jgi:hypothetical protein
MSKKAKIVDIQWVDPADSLPEDWEDVLFFKEQWIFRRVRAGIFIDGVFHAYSADDNLESWYPPSEVDAWARMPGVESPD